MSVVDENKELVRREIDEVWIKRNVDALHNFVGPDLLEEATEHVRQFLAAFSDIDVMVEDLIAEDDKVVGRLMISATHSGPFAGRAGTGKRISFASFRIYRVADGKVVETWAMQDRLALMEQLGLVQATAGPLSGQRGKTGNGRFPATFNLHARSIPLGMRAAEFCASEAGAGRRGERS